MTALHRIKCVSEINLEYAPHFVHFIFLNVKLMACTTLLAPPLTVTLNCFTPNNSTASMADSFAMHLATMRRITSPTAIVLLPVFFSFNAAKVALQKAGATTLASWLLPSYVTKFQLFGYIIHCSLELTGNWTIGCAEKMLWVHFGGPSCCEIQKSLTLQQEFRFIELKSFAAIVFHRSKNSVFSFLGLNSIIWLIFIHTSNPVCNFEGKKEGVLSWILGLQNVVYKNCF